MNERDALLKAVCENPDDDTPRLVFADWLQEHGDEARAEFIRVQIQLARGTHRPSEEARLKRRERKLLTTRGSQWQTEIGGYGHAIFRRGFLTHTAVHIDDLERTLASAPFEFIELEGEVNLIEVLQLPGIRRLGYLDLSKAAIDEATLETFAASDWSVHPWKLILPRGTRSEIQRRVGSRFGWVYFGRWW